jgi:diguanylate cyclase (GGDEF)-like protein/PAS domain S-box-containing protein
MSTVLIVDDKEINLLYLETLLKAHAFAVTSVTDGIEALATARSNPPDLIISDLLMPVMDGYTLLREWKTDATLCNIPFIVYTATYTEPEDERLALDLGADAFILKPSEPEAIMARIHDVQSRAHAKKPRQTVKNAAGAKSLQKVYNHVLVRKLEEKSQQLEETNRQLLRDINAHNSAEVMLRLLHSAVMQTQEAVMITDAQLDLPGPRIVFVNPAFTRMTGYSQEEVLGKSPRLLQGTETNRDMLARLREALQAAEPFEGEAINYRKDGTTFLQEWRITPLRDADGSLNHFLAIQRDITDSRREADALLESEQRLRQLAVSLETERERLAAAQRVAKVGSWETDLTTFEVIWSEETYRIHEQDPARFKPTHQAFLDIVHPEDRKMVNDLFLSSLLSPEPCSVEHRLLMPSGLYKSVEERWQIQFDADGRPLRAIGTCQDISERKLVETSLRESAAGIRRLNRVYAVLSQINALIVRATNRDELFAESCRIAAEVGGFRMAMICVADKETGLVHPVGSAGKSESLMKDVRRLLTSRQDVSRTMVGRVLLEKKTYVVNDSRNDSTLLLASDYNEAGVRSMAILPLIVANESVGALALYSAERDFFHADELTLLTELTSDISFAVDHIAKRDRLEYLTYYDDLTGLANRRLFIERVAQFARSAATHEHELAVFMFDLERFRHINDSLGRIAGDALLVQVAQWLTTNAKDPNLLARLGADVFAYVLPEVRSDHDLAELLKTKMGEFLSHPFHLDGNTFRIAAKAGVAIFPRDGEDDYADVLLKHAEAALKTAKSAGERFLFFDKAMTERIAVNLTLENQLRLALDNKEFVLYYQPKVNLQNNAVISAEALIRWQHPLTGLMPPGRFIPVLEETGLIHEVGRWALREAVRQCMHWRDAGVERMRIAVNVSPLQLRDRAFVADIESILAVDPRAADGLELEITESMIMSDIAHCIESLNALRKMGVRIAIDDFGTGFSSLSYLSRLPVDALKIDRSFIAEINETPAGLAIVSSVVTLAHSLNLGVVAEGVESDEQARLLRLIRCDELQGYFFSRPLAAEEFESRFLETRRQTSV